jgi:excisionase family DNA binding protein
MEAVTSIDLSELAKYLDQRFDAIDARLKAIEEGVCREEEVFYTIKQVEMKLNISRTAVNNAIDSGKLKKRKIGKRGIRISSIDLKEYMVNNFKLRKRRSKSYNF